MPHISEATALIVLPKTFSHLYFGEAHPGDLGACPKSVLIGLHSMESWFYRKALTRWSQPMRTDDEPPNKEQLNVLTMTQYISNALDTVELFSFFRFGVWGGSIFQEGSDDITYENNVGH